jgi:hypothetical protein
MITSRKVIIVVAAFVLMALGLPWGGTVPAAFAQTIAVTAADPPTGEQGTLNLTVKVTGKGFKNGAKAKFFKTGTTDPAGVNVKSTQYVSATQLIANIDIADTAALSAFDIQVQNTDGRTGKGTELFKVLGKGNVTGVTLLVATFRDDPGDMIQSDGLGPYFGSSRSNAVAAEIDTDGYLNFWPLHEGRSVLLAFPPPVRLGATALPDLMYEPVISWGLSTCCRSDPSSNPSPLGMQPGDVWVYSVRIRMETTTSFISKDWYTLRFNKTLGDPFLNYGHLQVTALDTNDNGVVDRWILEPLQAGTPGFKYGYDYMHLSRFTRKGFVDYGDYILPFQITLDAPGR